MAKYSFPGNGTDAKLKPVISHLQKMKFLVHIDKQSLYSFVTAYEKQINYRSVIGACIYNSINGVYIGHTQLLLLTMQNNTEGRIIK
jgi:hypothetical protein